jgi:hypothetical protein
VHFGVKNTSQHRDTKIVVSKQQTLHLIELARTCGEKQMKILNIVYIDNKGISNDMTQHNSEIYTKLCTMHQENLD